MGTIYIGQDAKYQLTTLDEAGYPANPSGVRFKIKDPSGSVATYALGSSAAVVEVTPGEVYTVTFDADEAGKWAVRAETLNGSGSVVGVDEDSLLVVASSVV